MFLLILFITMVIFNFFSSGLFEEGIGYTSYVDDDEPAYFKVLDLDAGISYNFTVDVEEWYQMDVGFSIHTEGQLKPKDALLTQDNPGTGDESTLFTPEADGDYYIFVFSNYDWGFFEVTVHEELSGNVKVVEPFSSPGNWFWFGGWDWNWRWLWITLTVIGGLVALVILIGITTAIVKSVNWRRVRLPRIRIDWGPGRRRRAARRARRREARRLRRERAFQTHLQLEEEGIKIIKEVPDTSIGARCMVAGLEINLDTDEVVACPFCKNVAKKPMLVEWLKVKGVCPICKEKLRIEICAKI